MSIVYCRFLVSRPAPQRFTTVFNYLLRCPLSDSRTFSDFNDFFFITSKNRCS